LFNDYTYQLLVNFPQCLFDYGSPGSLSSKYDTLHKPQLR